MTFVLATENSGKLAEMRDILSAENLPELRVISLSEAGAAGGVEETGATFRENALLKARAACGATGLPSIADDSGLCVDALDGAPGVYSKRYAGGGDLCDFLLKILENEEQRDAKFVSSIACVFPNGDVVEACGECRGEILRSKRGAGGFGYDPVFRVSGFDRSMAELMPGEKNAVSHRGAALRDFAGKLRAYLGAGRKRPYSKIGVYGGAFNPPHTGHMAFAAAARDCLDLDALYIVPTGEPPHKPMPDGSPDADRRLELARMAFEGLPRVEVSDCEIARGGVSYTADTVRRFSGEHPGATVYLITGTDMFLTLRNWKDAGSILETVVPAVGARRGGDAPKIRETAEIMRRELGVAPEIIEFEPVEMSSSRLRDALRAGEGKEYLAEGVYACIIRNGFYGARPELGWLRERAYAMLDDARVAHVAGCEREAALLAGRWGEDERSAREAAILHDVTKRLDAVEQMELCERYGICVDDVEREYTKLLHSKTGAAVARAEFCVSDAVYNAIMWHTTGRAGMTMLDKIIYIADYIEPTRDFEETARLKQLAYSDIDAAVEYGLEISIEDVTSRGAAPHPRSLEALRFLREAQP